MFYLLRPLVRTVRARSNASIRHKGIYTKQSSQTIFISRRLLWGSAIAVGTSTATLLSFGRPVRLDADTTVLTSENSVADPATLIEFPTTMRIPSKIRIPEMTLVGLGVRTVSFLGIKVYSVGFYADLKNPNLKISQDMTPEQKIEHIVKTSACVIRIVPVRTTSYTHLRDAFMRALQARMALGKKNGTLSEEQAHAVGSPMRKLKSLFPNSPLEKHSPLDILLTAPSEERQRTLIFRDLGAVESDWVATEFVLHYFEGAGPSPPLKKSVVDNLESRTK